MYYIFFYIYVYIIDSLLTCVTHICSIGLYHGPPMLYMYVVLRGLMAFIVVHDLRTLINTFPTLAWFYKALILLYRMYLLDVYADRLFLETCHDNI